MATDVERRIYRLAAACGVLAGFGLVAPRLAVGGSGSGLAGAATAVLVLLAVLLVAAGLAVYLLVITIRAFRQLSILSRIAGIVPAAVLVTALVLLIEVLRY